MTQEVARGSFDEAVDGAGTDDGRRVAKRQLDQLSLQAAKDFDEFYNGRGGHFGNASRTRA